MLFEDPVERPATSSRIPQTDQITMPTIKFIKEKKSVEVPAGTNLRKAALREGADLYWGPHKFFNCRGLGNCASCRVHIKKGLENVNKMGMFEYLRLLLGPVTFFARLGHEKDLRLACKVRVMGDVEVETQPEMNLHGEKFWA
ncbi:MAG: (2Fe-2S)-binding protein [Planctomycetaceae bacterium]|nr:(2Fe-2S)-binding protein [Planctomycetaceae bacterium]